jgi:hypothetical protein
LAVVYLKFTTDFSVVSELKVQSDYFLLDVTGPDIGVVLNDVVVFGEFLEWSEVVVEVSVGCVVGLEDVLVPRLPRWAFEGQPIRAELSLPGLHLLPQLVAELIAGCEVDLFLLLQLESILNLLLEHLNTLPTQIALNAIQDWLDIPKLPLLHRFNLQHLEVLHHSRLDTAVGLADHPHHGVSKLVLVPM